MKVEIDKSIEEIIQDCIKYETECIIEDIPELERTFADNIIFWVRIMKALRNDEQFKNAFIYDLSQKMRTGEYKNVTNDRYSGINGAILELPCVEQFRDGLWK